MSDTVKAVIMDGDLTEISTDKTLMEISKDYARFFKHPIILAKVDNELQELYKTLVHDCRVEFLDITDPNGYRTYQRSIVFLMLYAAKEVIGRDMRVVVEHSINKNYYCEIPGQGIDVTQELLDKIEEKMRETAAKDITIEKFSVPLEQSVRLAEDSGLKDKAAVMRYRRTSSVNFYRIDWFCDYFYGPMVPSTGYLKQFRLRHQGDGFILQFPSPENSDELAEFTPNDMVLNVFHESNQWAHILEVDTVGALNNSICENGLVNVIRVAEALHEKKIGNIADMICDGKKSLVLIAGPSSSGKTTFANRLCVQLRVNGMKPHIISLDDYYLNREHTPLDEYGKPNFECLEAIDVAQVNEDLAAPLEGRTVEIPSFNFSTGKREYKGRFISLGKGDVLVMEGIHGLNEKLTSLIPKKDKFKVFISALTQLNLDDHNYIPTTDTRLIRRIVRDSRHRGFDAHTTISVWPSVLRGENKYIFPHQEEADVFFNSALVYEMCMLKQYVEPHLFQIDKRLPEYTEARRLVKFLGGFLGAGAEQVPTNSILREFIGGSCFY